MVEIPSFNKWMSSHDIMWQIVFVQNLKIVPIILVLMVASIGGTALGVDNNAVVLMTLFGGATWFLMIKMWELNNMQTATQLTPINMTIRWNKTNWPQEINVIKDYIKIYEDPAKREFSYGVAMERPIKDAINGEEFSYFILNTPYDWKTTMSAVNKCFVAHGGSVFEAPAALITVVWASDFKSVVKEKGEYDVVPHRVFTLLTCPEDGEDYQKKIGVISADGELKVIERALKTFDTNNSVKTMFQLRDEKSLTLELVEQNKTTGEAVVEHAGTFLDNDRFIRKPNMLINWRSTKTRIALIIGAALLGAAIYWYVYVKPVTP